MKTCPHCQQQTLFALQGTQSVHCTNPDCAAYYITLPHEQFMALTPAQLDSYAGARETMKELQTVQDEFEARVEAIMKAQAERSASRQSNERLFG